MPVNITLVLGARAGSKWAKPPRPVDLRHRCPTPWCGQIWLLEPRRTTSRHLQPRRGKTPWRFKSSHPHSQITCFQCVIRAQTCPSARSHHPRRPTTRRVAPRRRDPNRHHLGQRTDNRSGYQDGFYSRGHEERIQRLPLRLEQLPVGIER